MLDELHVKDLALIRDVSLVPASGLTVITGETGTGKTALMSALALLAGGRGDAGAVREGTDGLLVEGRFVFPTATGNAEEDAESLDQMADTNSLRSKEVVVSRQVTADGRSRVHIDGSIASVGQLAEGTGATMDLCGQHEHQRLMHVAHHREMLDAWAFDDLLPFLESYANAYVAARDAAEALAQLEAASTLSAEAIEQARFTMTRIDEVSPMPDEYDELRSTLDRAEHAEALAQQTGGAHEALSGEGGALDALGAAASALEEAARTDSALGDAARSLREASYVVEDVARDVRSYRDGIDFDASRLADMQERMGLLQGLMRSFGPTIEEVIATRERAEATVSAVDQSEEQISHAHAVVQKCEEELSCAARALHEARTAIAPRFADAVTAQMQRLELAGAALECNVEMSDRSNWTLTGPDHVEFLFKPAAGMGARPLVRIASGGEVSRVMLAIKVVLGSADDVATLVFDEVDAGVGGSAARALAEVLSDLATTHQLIVITHLPQVAVLGDAHYVGRKPEGDLPEPVVNEVRGQARVAEVARMLSGDTGGVSRAHAAHLLEEAQARRSK